VRQELKLDANATYADLDATVWSRGNDGISSRIVFFLRALLTSRRDEIKRLRVFPQAHAGSINLRDLDLSLRITNSLKTGLLYSDQAALSAITFGRLFAVKNFGAASLLEFSCTVDASLESDLRPTAPDPVNGKPEAADDRRTCAEAASLRTILTELRAALSREAWAHQLSERDIRYRAMFPPGYGTILFRIDELLEQPDCTLIRNGATRLVTLEAAAGRLSIEHARWSNLTIEEAARELLALLTRGVQGSEERRSILLQVLHWSGEEKALTLEEAGAVLGITRERVRQIETRVNDNLRKTNHEIPQVYRAVRALEERLPLTVAEAIDVIGESGPSAIHFQPSSLLALAESLGIPTEFSIAEVGDAQVLVRPDDLEPLHEIARRAKRLAQMSGATSLDRLSEALSETSVRIESAARLRNYVRGLTAVFVDAEEEWFCFPNKDNVVLSTTRKMLAVTEPLSIDSIRGGIGKVFRFRNSTAGDRGIDRLPIPRAILTGLLKTQTSLVVDKEGMVRFSTTSVRENTLPSSERALLTAFETSNDGLISRAAAIESFLETGLSVGSATTMLTYSPIIERIGPDRWCLVGRKAEFGPIFARARPAGPGSRVLRFGWTPLGELYVHFRAPDGLRAPSITIRIPSRVQEYVQEGDYRAATTDGIAVGNVIVAEHGRTTGFARFFQLAGVESGDVVGIRFSIDRMTAQLQVLSDDLGEAEEGEAV
jgi:hypothetical protein